MWGTHNAAVVENLHNITLSERDELNGNKINCRVIKRDNVL